MQVDSFCCKSGYVRIIPIGCSVKTNFKDTVKNVSQAFINGCFGCFGAMVTVVVMLLIGGLVFGSIFGSNISQAVNTLFDGVAQAIDGLSNILQGITGPFSNSDASLMPTPTGELPSLEVFMTNGENAQGKHLTNIPQSDSPQAFFWVRTEKGVEVTFRLMLTVPDGSADQFGPLFTTKSDGQPRNCGRFATRAQVGNYTLKAMIGNTVVGELNFVVE